MPTLKTVLIAVRKELVLKDELHDKAQGDMRQVTSLSKQAILLIHQKRLKEAKKLVVKASETLSTLWDASTAHPDIIYTGLFSAALQEYSEANIFLTLVRESKYFTPKEINVPSEDYVLGLADVIGECRRLTLDDLREGNTERAEKCLQTMDEIYTELMAMDESYMLVPGLRRKCDVARKVIEITRGDVTQEIRRSMLEEHLKRVEKSLRNRKHLGGKLRRA
jgi:translin